MTFRLTSPAKMLEKNRIQQLDIPSRKGYEAIFNATLTEDVLAATKSWSSRRILLIASRGLVQGPYGSKHVCALQRALGTNLVDTKVGVGSHSPYADVRDIADRIQRFDADCVVCVGSSSYSDATMIACTLAANLQPGFTLEDMEALVDKEKGHAETKDGKPWCPRKCKLILVPTSLSASEWNAVSSATNTQGKKQHFGDWDSGFADLILLDPEVASTSPPKLWLSSGVRVIDHCVELMCNPMAGEDKGKGVNEFADKGLRSILKGLSEYKVARDRGINSDKDREVLLKGISDCQYGSREGFSGLMIYRNPMGPSHAIGHQLGSIAHVMHGITSCVMLPPVVRWQAANLGPKIPHYLQAQSRILAIFNDTVSWEAVDGNPSPPATAADAIERFVVGLGMPSKLNQVGVTSDEQVKEIAEKTMTDVWGGGKRQLEFEEILEIVQSARV